MYDNLGNEISEEKCPFCRAPLHISIEDYNEGFRDELSLAMPRRSLIEEFTIVMEKMVVHKMMTRHLNYLFGQEILVVPKLIAMLVMHITMVKV